MFDNALPKTRRSFCFGDVSVAVRLVDDDPGAVQSGHYVWPAAPALSAYLVDRRLALPRGGRCLELGAGCGLAGLVAAQLEATSAVVFTDHDPGVLDMIRESIAEQERDPELGGSQAAAKCRCVPLSWGPVGKRERGLLADALSNASASSTSRPPPPTSRNLVAEDGLFRDTSGDGGVGEKYVGGAAARVGPPEAAEEPSKAGPEGAAEEVGLGREADGDCGGGGGGSGGGGVAEVSVGFDLVIASDVIYSVSVVRPLFQTVADLLHRDDRPRGEETTTRQPPPNLAVAGAAAAAAAARRELPAEEEAEIETANSDPVVGKGPRHGAPISGEEEPAAVSSSTPPQQPPPQHPSQAPWRRSDEGEGAAADGSPMFFMSQSFRYDAATERDIDRACRELGLSREVVWDELPVDATAPGGRGAQQLAKGDGGVVRGRRGHPLAALDSDIGGGDSGRVCGDGGGEGAPQMLLSGGMRAGTKLQRFWRL
eukprot:g5970.t1